MTQAQAFDLANEKYNREHPVVINYVDAISNPEKLFSILEYGSYAANRDYGMTHEQLLSIGIGNDGMKLQYESENFTKQIPID